MARSLLVILLMMLASVTSACTGRAHAAPGARSDRSVITREQLLENQFTTVHDAVQALRGNWLLTKGTDSFAAPTEVQVYMDNIRLGGVQTLKTIAANTVQSIRYYDGITASARWGLDHGQGVIFITTSR